MPADTESTRMGETGDGELSRTTRAFNPYAYRDPAQNVSDSARDETPPPESHTHSSMWPDEASRDSVRCYPCNKLFYSAAALEEHQNTSQLEWHANLKCLSCPLIYPFKSHAEVQAHYRTPEHSLLCVECNMFFDDETELDCHFAQSHSDHLSCYRCSITFPNALERHAHFYDSDYHALIRFAGHMRRKILGGPGTDTFSMPPPPPRGRSHTRRRRSRSPEPSQDSFNHRNYDASYRHRNYPHEYFPRRKPDNFGQPDVHVTRTHPRPTVFAREYLTPRHRVQNSKHAPEEERIHRGRTARYGRGGYKKPPGFVPGRTNRNNDHVPPVTPQFGDGGFIPYNFNRRPSALAVGQAREVISYEEGGVGDSAVREPSPLELDAKEEIISVSYTAPARPRAKIDVFAAAPPDFFQIAINEYGRLGDGEKLKEVMHFMQYDWEYSEAAQLEMVRELEEVVRVGREFMREAGLEVEGVAGMVGGVMIAEMEGGGQDEAAVAVPFHPEAARTDTVQTDAIHTGSAHTEYVQGITNTVDQEKEDEAMMQHGSPPSMLTNTQKEEDGEQLYGEGGMQNQVDSPRSVMACDGSVAAPSSPVAGAWDGALEDMVDYGDSQD